MWEQVGEVKVVETVNLEWVGEHIVSLARENNRRGYTQGVLEARALASEATDVLKLVRVAVRKEEQSRASRHKRNILGDILSSLTGLATQDSLKQQQTYDRELRRKMEALVREQQVEANIIEKLVYNITQEEETMDGRIDQLQATHQRDIYALQQHSARMGIVRQDMKVIQDILVSTQTGTATAEQGIKFTARFGMEGTPHFRYHNITVKGEVLMAVYSAAMYKEVEVKWYSEEGQGWQARTGKNTYIVQERPTKEMHISWQEVELVGGWCEKCLTCTHTGQEWYRVEREGWISCQKGGNNTYRKGTLLHIEEGEHCWNDIIQVHSSRGGHEVLHIDMGLQGTVDEQIMQRMIANGSKVEEARKRQMQHRSAQQSLHKSILVTQQEVKELTEWAEKAESQQTEQQGWLQAWLSAAAVVGMLLVCCGGMVWGYSRYKKRDKDSQEGQEEVEQEEALAAIHVSTVSVLVHTY